MLGSSLQHIDEIRKKGYRPQVVGCFINNKQILFVYKKEHDLWQLPQGGIDNQESIDQAFWREFGEELGHEFMSGCEKNIRMIGADEIKFTVKNLRELNSDEGKRLHMRGKKYFFVVANISDRKIDIEQTEFDEYKWVGLDEALGLTQTINQVRKQKMMTKILNLLKKRELLA